MNEVALLLDMDGVLTHTQALHLKAWARTFETFFHDNRAFRAKDYYRFIDGKTRLEGARSYLEHKGVELREGESGDTLHDATLWGLCNFKKELYLSLLPIAKGLLYPDTVRFLSQWTRKHIALAAVSSSESAEMILKSSGVDIYFDAIVTPHLGDKLKLRSRPYPDFYTHAAQLLGFDTKDCIIVDDAISGMQAGLQIKNELGLKALVGVVRDDFTRVEINSAFAKDKEAQKNLREKALYAAGANFVVHDLSELNSLLIQGQAAA